MVGHLVAGRSRVPIPSIAYPETMYRKAARSYQLLFARRADLEARRAARAAEKLRREQQLDALLRRIQKAVDAGRMQTMRTTQITATLGDLRRALEHPNPRHREVRRSQRLLRDELQRRSGTNTRRKR